MPWPTVPVVTTGMDADTDTLPRADILDHTNKFNQLIAMRGVADGVCELDSAALVPTTKLPGRLATLSGITATQATDLAALSAFMGTVLNDADHATALTTLRAPLNSVVAKSATFIVGISDRGTLFDSTGTWTLNLDPVATLGNGFAVVVRNSGTGVITIDPNGAELIDGAATITLAAGESCFVVCNGSAWKTVGRVSLASSLAANGYQKLPGGLILQWGTIAVATRASWEYDFGLINLPIAFPTAALNASATVLTTDAVGAIDGFAAIKSISLTQINPVVGSTVTTGGNFGVYWQAIGY